jgi:hypothetical protein
VVGQRFANLVGVSSAVVGVGVGVSSTHPGTSEWKRSVTRGGGMAHAAEELDPDELYNSGFTPPEDAKRLPTW